MEKDLNILISRNARYYLYGNRMFDAKNEISFNLKEAKLSQIIEMLKDNLNLKYSEGEILFEEVTKFTRKTAYKIFECFDKNKEMNLMMEYEVKFGSNLLVESKLFNQKKTLQESWEFLHETVISELELPQWMKDAGKSISNTAGKVWDKTKEKATQAANLVKDKVGQATTFLISKGVPTVMEGIRAVMFSWGGAIVSTILAVIPGLNLLNIVAWGALLLWDVMEAINGRVNWAHIIVDIVGIVFSGGMAKGLMLAIGKIFGSVSGLVGKSLTYVVNLIGKTSVGKTLLSGAGTLASGLGKVLKVVADAVAWLASKFGIKSFQTIPGKVRDFFNKIVSAFKGTPAASTSKNVAKSGGKLVKNKINPISKISSKKFGTSTVGATAVSAGVAGGLTYGLSDDKSVFGTNMAIQQQQQMNDLDNLGPSEIEVV
jgi:hypothetical protein